MQNTTNRTARTCIAIVPAHLADVVKRALLANYSISNAYVDFRGDEGHVFAALAGAVACDKEMVAVHKHSMRIFAMGVVAGLCAQ